jgi:arylsulfatase A-like enzyme
MLLREPGGAGAGNTSDWFASTHDVAPTLASLAGMRRPASFEGADLSPILAGGMPAEECPYAVGGYGNYSYVRDRRWAYMTRNDWRDERLYDLATDPGERQDLASTRSDIISTMRRRVRDAAGGRPPLYPESAMGATPRRRLR